MEVNVSVDKRTKVPQWVKSKVKAKKEKRKEVVKAKDQSFNNDLKKAKKP